MEFEILRIVLEVAGLTALTGGAGTVIRYAKLAKTLIDTIEVVSDTLDSDLPKQVAKEESKKNGVDVVLDKEVSKLKHKKSNATN